MMPMSNAMDNLTPEMKARLAQIMAGNTPQPAAVDHPDAAAAAAAAPVQAPVKPPSLMDHVIALRQEVAALRQEVANNSNQLNAQSNVVDAVGQAVGSLYQMFQPTSQPNAQGPTFSQGFQQSVNDSDY